MKNMLMALSAMALGSTGLSSASVAVAQGGPACRAYCVQEFGQGGPNEDPVLLRDCYERCRVSPSGTVGSAKPKLDAKRD